MPGILLAACSAVNAQAGWPALTPARRGRGHAERVVVEPQGGRPLVVRVLEDGATRPPPVTERGPVPEVAVERAVPREAGGDVACPGQVPRLGVAVAVVEGVAAVHVGDDRHRTAVPPRGASEPGLRITSRRAARRVRPVQGRVHRKQVRPEVPVPVDQAVDPRHPHRAPVPRLDREGGGVERARVVHRPVAPDGGRRQIAREHLRPELADRDLVVVDPAPRGERHLRRDDQRCHVLPDAEWVERPSRGCQGGVRRIRETDRRHQGQPRGS